jgi:hypothetical protein
LRVAFLRVAFLRVAFLRVAFLRVAFFFRAAILGLPPLFVDSSTTVVPFGSKLRSAQLPRELARRCCSCPLSETGLRHLKAIYLHLFHIPRH